MHLQCFPPTRYVRGGATCAHRLDDLYPILPKLEYRQPACIVWFYSTKHPTQLCHGFRTIFFCLVCGLLEKKQQKINDLVYRVQLTPRSKPKVLHCNRLWRYTGLSPPTWLKDQDGTEGDLSPATTTPLQPRRSNCQRKPPERLSYDGI